MLGATMPHVVVDGQSMYGVLQAIATAYSEFAGAGEVAHPMPVSHDRAAFLREAPENLEAWEPDPYFGTPPAPPPVKNARRCVVIPPFCWAATRSEHVHTHDAPCSLQRHFHSARALSAFSLTHTHLPFPPAIDRAAQRSTGQGGWVGSWRWPCGAAATASPRTRW